MHRIPRLMTLAAAAFLAGCVEDGYGDMGAGVGMPSVGSSTDLSSFQGARAGQAETGIQSLGYQAIRSEGLTTYWFNRATGACARITTADGRYETVAMLPAEDGKSAACTSAVRAETGNPDVSVRRSSFSEAGTEVLLQVGPTGSWRCIGYSDGSTAGIESLTDEGAL